MERLAPGPRRRFKQALRELEHGEKDCLPLRENLAGYHRLRIGGHRVIFRYLPGGIVECVFAEERSLVYQLFEREVIGRLRREEEGSWPRLEEPVAKYEATKKLLKSRRAPPKRK